MAKEVSGLSRADKAWVASQGYNLTGKWHNKLVSTFLPKKELKGAGDWVKAPFQYTAFAIAHLVTTPFVAIAHLFARLGYEIKKAICPSKKQADSQGQQNRVKPRDNDDQWNSADLANQRALNRRAGLRLMPESNREKLYM